MSQDHTADYRSGGPQVVEWGGDEGARRARTPPRALARVLRDRRLVPVTAGLGLVAVFASLLGEWTIVTLANEGPNGSPLRLPLGVADIAAYGAAYLVGEFAIAVMLALVLFGAPAIRHNSRVIGIATAGGVLALLAAITASFEKSLPWQFTFNPETKLMVELGRGLVMAYVGTAALGLALYLAGRFIPSPAGADRPAVTTSESGDPAGSDPIEGDDWPWRRPRQAGPNDAQQGPTDLTVAPAAPFVLPEQQDRG